MGAATGALLGAVGVDLQSDLGLQGPPDGRRWAVKLHTGAELLVSFRAHTPFIFPHMAMRNIDGMAATVALPYKPLPELEITIYQAIRLSGVQSPESLSICLTLSQSSKAMSKYLNVLGMLR